MFRKLFSNSQASRGTYPPCLTVAVPLPVNRVKVPVLLREKPVGVGMAQAPPSAVSGSPEHHLPRGRGCTLATPLSTGGERCQLLSIDSDLSGGTLSRVEMMNNKQHIYTAPVLPKDLKVLYKRKDKLHPPTPERRLRRDRGYMGHRPNGQEAQSFLFS